MKNTIFSLNEIIYQMDATKTINKIIDSYPAFNKKHLLLYTYFNFYLQYLKQIKKYNHGWESI